MLGVKEFRVVMMELILEQEKVLSSYMPYRHLIQLIPCILGFWEPVAAAKASSF